MNIKDKITEWANHYRDDLCCNEDERMAVDGDLELVLFAIDTLTNNQVEIIELDLPPIPKGLSITQHKLIKGES